jgi:hypothetical protein
MVVEMSIRPQRLLDISLSEVERLKLDFLLRLDERGKGKS